MTDVEGAKPGQIVPIEPFVLRFHNPRFFSFHAQAERHCNENRLLFAEHAFPYPEPTGFCPYVVEQAGQCLERLQPEPIPADRERVNPADAIRHLH